MIKEFIAEYAWLSNFYNHPIEWKGVVYQSLEHAYQSEKSEQPEWKDFCANCRNAGRIKRASRDVILIDNWHNKKLDVMEELLRIKFKESALRDYLLSTKDQEILEGNRWKDLFWGVDIDTLEGENHLGKLIMKIRKEILENQ